MEEDSEDILSHKIRSFLQTFSICFYSVASIDLISQKHDTKFLFASAACAYISIMSLLVCS